MAKNDRKKVQKKDVEYKPVTAADVLAPYGDDVTPESWALAGDESRVAPAYVDYEKALENYESRSDVETLDARRRRDVGGDFHAAEFRRNSEVAEAGLMTTDAVEAGPAKAGDAGAEGPEATSGADTKGQNPKK